jgi:hypothetical protein
LFVRQQSDFSLLPAREGSLLPLRFRGFAATQAGNRIAPYSTLVKIPGV